MNSIQTEFNSNKYVKENGGIYLPFSKDQNSTLLTAKLMELQMALDGIQKSNPHIPRAYVNIINSMSINAITFKTENYHIGLHKGFVLELINNVKKVIGHDFFTSCGFFSKRDKSFYQQRIIYYSLMFIIQHEFSHIRYGHLDFVMCNLGMDNLFELVENSCQKEKNIDMQTLEFDADCTAVNLLVQHIIKTYDSDLRSEMLIVYNSVCKLIKKGA